MIISLDFSKYFILLKMKKMFEEYFKSEIVVQIVAATCIFTDTAQYGSHIVKLLKGIKRRIIFLNQEFYMKFKFQSP